jgi:MFS family permease
MTNDYQVSPSAENDHEILTSKTAKLLSKYDEILQFYDDSKPATAPAMPAEQETPRSAGLSPQDEKNKLVEKAKRGLEFWAIIAALCMTSMLASLENTVVSTSLPTIVATLNIGHNYIWVTNVFFLTRYVVSLYIYHITLWTTCSLIYSSAAVQPLFGQIANVFGRRWLAIFIVVTFTAICGAANNGGALVAGRAIQGIGSGGINMIVDVIVSDLVPLRERGNFMGTVLGVYSVGTALGPFLGGIIVEKTTWRWVFLITLPFGGASIILLFLFLHVQNKRLTLLEALKRIDFIGNALIIVSSISILFALTYAGSPYSWSSWRILVPLILGFCGYIQFIFFEGSKFCTEPVIPLRLFNNRTSAVVYINTFINSMLLYWVMFFLPIYFQVALGSSPARSGVQLLPIILVAVPGAVIAVVVLSKFGRYKLLHLAGFAIATLGTGLFILLDQHSSTAKWVVFQVYRWLRFWHGSQHTLTRFPSIASRKRPSGSYCKLGFHSELWKYLGHFHPIPAAIFNNRIDNILYRITDESTRQAIAGGRAYEIGPAILKATSSPELRDQIQGVYSDALKIVWAVGAGFGALSFLLVFIEKEVALRKELETDYILREKTGSSKIEQ